MPDRNNYELDIFQQLKPLFGRKIDECWIAYVAGSPQQKARIIQRLTLLSIQVQDKRVGDRKIYLEPPRESVIGGGDYTLGEVVFPGKAPYDFTIYRHELLRHVFIDGPSGSGKTTLIQNLIEQLDIPWLALDWKRSFRCLMASQDAIVLTLSTTTAPLRVNMLLPPPGVSTAAWVECLSDIICNGYLLMDGARSKLKKVFLDATQRYGKNATLRDALTLLQQELYAGGARGRAYGWLESTERALKELSTGFFGDCLNEREHPMLVGDLLEQRIIIELEGLGRSQGTTICVFFLQATLLIRQKQLGKREVLQHAMIIDEAQNVFRPEARWEPLSVPSKTIREIREYGECIISAAQNAEIADSLLANTGTKIVMRTNAVRDLDYFSKSFQVDPGVITRIPTGQAIAVIPDRYPRAFLFSFKPNQLKNMLVTEDSVRERYEQWRAGKPLTSGGELPEAIHLRERELELLHDIAKHPLRTTMEHYDAFSWNPKVGNDAKNKLLFKQVIDVVTLETGRERRKFLTLTDQGKALITQRGGTITKLGTGGIEHEYWRQKIRSMCEASGYRVTPEYDLGNERYVDLRAQRSERTLLIEIETGKSDVPANIYKLTGQRAQLVMFFTNKKSQEQNPTPHHITSLNPETLEELQRILQ